MHTHSYNVLNIDIHILHARYVELGSWWQADNICSPYTRIYMVTEGNGFLAWRDQKILMEPGYIYIIPAGLRFSFGCPDKLYKTFFHISIPTPDGYDLLEQLNQCIVLHASERVGKITAALAENSVKSMLEIKAYLYSLISQSLSESPPLQIRKYSDYTTKIIQYVNQVQSASLTVEAIAKELFTSSSKLRNTFRHETGMTIGSYIHDRSLYYAELQVRCSTKSIKEISESLGYCDQFYFSRCFTRKFGLSPAKYRERLNI